MDVTNQIAVRFSTFIYLLLHIDSREFAWAIQTMFVAGREYVPSDNILKLSRKLLLVKEVALSKCVLSMQAPTNRLHSNG